MKYHKKYILIRDTPSYPKGWPLKWDGRRRRYYFPKVSKWSMDKGSPDIYLDYEGPSYSLDEVQAKGEWFKPDSEATEYIPQFPSKTEIQEYVYLELTTRLVDDVDVCRALNDVFDDKTFQDNLYEFVRAEYNRVHKLKDGSKS